MTETGAVSARDGRLALHGSPREDGSLQVGTAT